MTNKIIADTLEEIALYLQAQDVAFKPQAYEIAAQGVRDLNEELTEIYKRCGTKCIDDISGIGKSIAEKIEEMIQTGKIKEHRALKKQFPFPMLELTQIPDVGPKTALTLFQHLQIKTVAQLEHAARQGKIADVPGMGVKSQRKILRGIQFLKGSKGRRIIHQVLPYAKRIVSQLQNTTGTTHVDIAGSLRRHKETIGDIDLIATTSKPKQFVQIFISLPEIDRVLEQGSLKVMVQYKNGLTGDLLLLKPQEYGAALLYFSGSREHNILLREHAKRMGLKLSEHGLFKGTKRITSKTEKQIYASLGLQEIPPELRVGGDEIEIAKHHQIPELIVYGSLKGDLQVQTDWSDGSASIEEMTRVAKTFGLSYMAVTDHTQTLAITNGLDEKRLLKQGKEIDALNKKLKGFRVLKSTECDIKKDGSLDLQDRVLKTLDVVSVSVHSNRLLPKQQMTERIIRALKHPLVHVFMHPTGRIVGVRDGYSVDMDRVIKAAKEYHVALEVNGSERLDIPENCIRKAIDLGVKLTISSDAHEPEHFQNLDYGIGQARRGWVKKADVLNTKTCAEFLKAIKK